MNRESLDALLLRARLPVAGEEYERLLRVSEIIDRQRGELRFAEARDLEPASIYSALDLPERGT